MFGATLSPFKCPTGSIDQVMIFDPFRNNRSAKSPRRAISGIDGFAQIGNDVRGFVFNCRQEVLLGSDPREQRWHQLPSSQEVPAVIGLHSPMVAPGGTVW